MSCITCHNPHVSVKETPNSQYLNACKNCHASKDCMAPVAERNANEDNCVKCHMPKNGSIDIPHVAVTDHYIRRKPNTDKELKETVKFIAMRCYNSDEVDERTRARSFMEFHERYEPAKIFLDSAKKYLLSAEVKQTEADWIRLLFLQKSFNEIIQLSDLPLAENIQDAWTAYRIGEAYLSLQNFAQAIQYLSRACDLKPKALDFQSKLSTAYGLSGNQNMSEKVSLFILSQHPRYAMALFNLGVIALQRQNLQSAEKYLFQAMQANPDHVQTLVNYAVVLYQQNRKSEINQLLLRALKLDPDNQQIQMMLKDLGQSTTKPF
jgi:tetratricopeptide (TPR) repeat protein